MNSDGNENLQFYLIDCCRALKIGETVTLKGEVCEEAWPRLPSRCVPEELSYIQYEDFAAPVRAGVRVVPATLTPQRMKQALGPDFRVEATQYGMQYHVTRKNFSVEPSPAKPATTLVGTPPPPPRKPTAKRVKPGDHMKETPLVQRFSQLDLD
jgi:hypothetical protein